MRSLKTLNRGNRSIFAEAPERIEKLFLSTERINFVAPIVTREAENSVKLKWWGDGRALEILVMDDESCFSFCQFVDDSADDWMEVKPSEGIGVLRDLLAWVIPVEEPGIV